MIFLFCFRKGYVLLCKIINQCKYLTHSDRAFNCTAQSSSAGVWSRRSICWHASSVVVMMSSFRTSCPGWLRQRMKTLCGYTCGKKLVSGPWPGSFCHYCFQGQGWTFMLVYKDWVMHKSAVVKSEQLLNLHANKSITTVQSASWRRLICLKAPDKSSTCTLSWDCGLLLFPSGTIT